MSRTKNEKIILAQRDGSTVTLIVSGDEFYARSETEDGYTVVYDRVLGMFCYAYLFQGAFISSGIPTIKNAPAGIRKHLRETGSVIESKFNLRFQLREPPVRPGPPVSTYLTFGEDNGLLAGDKIHKGKVLGLTVLVEFQDVSCTVKSQDISSMLNDDGYKGNGNFCSVREYFLMMSGNRLEYSNEVYGPIKLKYNRDYYHFTRKNEILIEALNTLENQGIDFRRFDSSGDGKIDAINIMYSGATQYVDRSWLWPHNFYHEMRVGGVSTYFYQICSLESMSIGTFCHENGHMLCRFPDLYDYGNRDNDFVRSSGLGNYCLMSAGNHLDNGRTPAPFSAYLRYLAGWYDKEILLNQPSTYEVLQGDYSNIYKFMLNDLPNEYFLVENRHKIGIDLSSPSDGLAVYHCDVLGSNEWQQGTPSKHYQCALLQADGHRQLENGSNMGDKNDFFSNIKGIAISYGTNPSSQRWDRSDSMLTISNISKAARKMTFETK